MGTVRGQYPGKVQVSVEETTAEGRDPGEDCSPLHVVGNNPEKERSNSEGAHMQFKPRGFLLPSGDILADPHNCKQVFKDEDGFIIRSCVCVCVCVCVCAYLGSVLLMSLKRSLKYWGTRTMTCSEEEMERLLSSLVSTTRLTKPSQSNCRRENRETRLTRSIKGHL